MVWDDVNQWRSAMGLSLIGTSGTGKKNYAPIYEHQYMFLFSDVVASGAKKDIKLETYHSVSESAVTKEYSAINSTDLKNYVQQDKNELIFYGDVCECNYCKNGEQSSIEPYNHNENCLWKKYNK